MSDMKPTIIAKSDQLNSDDLVSGPVNITITGVTVRGGADQPVSIHYQGDNGKPYKPCKTVCRVLVAIWGEDSKSYVGRSMTLYRDPDVTWAGVKVTGIRVSHMSNMKKAITLPLAVSKGRKNPVVIRPLALDKDPQTLIEAGNNASLQGVETYTKWIATLSDAEKNTVKDNHTQWSADAKEVDAMPEDNGETAAI